MKLIQVSLIGMLALCSELQASAKEIWLQKATEDEKRSLGIALDTMDMNWHLQRDQDEQLQNSARSAMDACSFSTQGGRHYPGVLERIGTPDLACYKAINDSFALFKRKGKPAKYRSPQGEWQVRPAPQPPAFLAPGAAGQARQDLAGGKPGGAATRGRSSVRLESPRGPGKAPQTRSKSPTTKAP